VYESKRNRLLQKKKRQTNHFLSLFVGNEIRRSLLECCSELCGTNVYETGKDKGREVRKDREHEGIIWKREKMMLVDTMHWFDRAVLSSVSSNPNP
jgi:hypothetical protein